MKYQLRRDPRIKCEAREVFSARFGRLIVTSHPDNHDSGEAYTPEEWATTWVPVVPAYRSPNEFMECESCRKKSGTPILCKACVHNRRLISELKVERDRLQKKADEFQEASKVKARALLEVMQERDEHVAARRQIAEALEPGHDLMLSEILERIRRLRKIADTEGNEYRAVWEQLADIQQERGRLREMLNTALSEREEWKKAAQEKDAELDDLQRRFRPFTC